MRQSRPVPRLDAVIPSWTSSLQAGVQVAVLDHSTTAYTVGQLFNDVNSQLSAKRCMVEPGSHLTLKGIQAEEGLPQKSMAPKVCLHSLKGATLLLGHALLHCKTHFEQCNMLTFHHRNCQMQAKM